VPLEEEIRGQIEEENVSIPDMQMSLGEEKDARAAKGLRATTLGKEGGPVRKKQVNVEVKAWWGGKGDWAGEGDNISSRKSANLEHDGGHTVHMHSPEPGYES